MKTPEILIGLGLALFVGTVLSPFASSWPDGLEKVAEHYGFLSKAAEKPLTPEVIPGYAMPGIESESLATSVAGFLGTLLLYFGGYALARGLRRAPGVTEPEKPTHEA